MSTRWNRSKSRDSSLGLTPIPVSVTKKRSSEALASHHRRTNPSLFGTLKGVPEEIEKHPKDPLGMGGFFPEVLPDQKQKKVKELQGNGAYVGMTGDRGQ